MLLVNSCGCSVGGKTIRLSSQSSRVRYSAPLFFFQYFFWDVSIRNSLRSKYNSFDDESPPPDRALSSVATQSPVCPDQPLMNFHYVRGFSFRLGLLGLLSEIRYLAIHELDRVYFVHVS